MEATPDHVITEIVAAEPIPTVPQVLVVKRNGIWERFEVRTQMPVASYRHRRSHQFVLYPDDLEVLETIGISHDSLLGSYNNERHGLKHLPRNAVRWLGERFLSPDRPGQIGSV